MTPEQAKVLARCMRDLREVGLGSRRLPIHELRPVIEAYGEGKIVQVFDDPDWLDVKFPVFDHDWTRYRVKPEPTFRPFNQNELVSLLGKRVVTSDGRKHRITKAIIEEQCSNVFCEDERKNGQYFCAESLLKHCKFADGTPCGIKE